MNLKADKNRIYHPWGKWEDYHFNFYDNCTGKEKEVKIQSVLNMFNSVIETERCMNYVVDNWTHSMEHNLTNPSMNKIAYIGQCACAYYSNIPNIVTMTAWNLLSERVRDRSDKQALHILKLWEQKKKLKDILKAGKQKGIAMEYQMNLQLN